MPDSGLLGDLAAAISYLQSALNYHGLGDLCGIEVNAAAHLRLSSLNLHDIVELDTPRDEIDPEIAGVPIRQGLSC